MLLTLLLACNPDNIGADRGLKMSDYFPQDGDRKATYKNEDAAIEAQLYVEKQQPSTKVGSVTVWNWAYYRQTDTQKDLLYMVEWAAPSGDGVQIYSYTDVDGNKTSYDPPIIIAPISDYMKAGDAYTTDTNGESWTSTLVEVVPTCEVEWGSITWEECAHFTIENGGDAATDPEFAGDYWQVTTYGTAWFQPSGSDSKWVVLKYDWTPDES